MEAEQTILKISIGVTILIACSGIAFGIVTGSFSIAFDGVYSLADASMSTLALVVARLIASDADPARGKGKLRARFSLGFWHLEPIVLGLNGILLMSVAVYALINAIISILSGGHALEFDYAILYAGITLAACLTMAAVVRRKNATIRSGFLTLDATAWLMSAGITAALLIAFIGGFFVDGTQLAWIAPYIDPAVSGAGLPRHHSDAGRHGAPGAVGYLADDTCAPCGRGSTKWRKKWSRNRPSCPTAPMSPASAG